jgi:hypothetical protein
VNTPVAGIKPGAAMNSLEERKRGVKGGWVEVSSGGRERRER